MEMSQSKNGKKIVFSESSFNKIAQSLQALKKRSNAALCIFADANGYAVSFSGEAKEIDISSLSALAAGDFAATSEMARIISGEDKFRYLYHEGKEKNVYLCSVGDDYLIIVVFDKSVALGIVRAMTHHLSLKLEDLLAKLRQEAETASDFLDSQFRELLSAELDKSFGVK
ncbi:hypothetical protein A2V82_02575 [candidate division KSB1 bacterium RBG_16_48_16]|nr:MAG: hypothetical protein A2V82_02575 [candidate division KSB1 bacterium RBG_16_48_16]